MAGPAAFATCFPTLIKSATGKNNIDNKKGGYWIYGIKLHDGCLSSAGYVSLLADERDSVWVGV